MKINILSKKILILILIVLFLLLGSIVSSSYITKMTDFKYEYGIKIDIDNTIIENLVFKDIPIGICVWSSNNIIRNCTFISCSDEGIILIGSNNTIENCVFYKCVDGVELQQSSDNVFIYCRFLGNTHAGIDAIKNNNNNNIIDQCVFIDNLYGSYFSKSIKNEYIDCVFSDNYKDKHIS